MTHVPDGVVVHTPPRVIFGGVRVAETPTHFIDVMVMIFNYRIVTTPRDAPLTYDGGWCYKGTSREAWLHVVYRAIEMAMEGLQEPIGWNKNVFTGEWRENGDDPDPVIRTRRESGPEDATGFGVPEGAAR